MRRRTMDPDVTWRNDAPYWAAALVLAIRAGDKTRIEEARRELARLGIYLTTASAMEPTSKPVRRDLEAPQQI